MSAPRSRVRPPPGAGAVALLSSAVTAGCEGVQSALDPAGAQAAAVAGLWWGLLGAASLVVVVVTALLLYGALRAPPEDPAERVEGERRKARAVAAGALLSLGVLAATLVASVLVGRAALSQAPAAAPLVIEVTGYRFWWEVRYLGAGGEEIATSANEIHLPVGQAVPVRVRTADVIHSFWVPSLAGKIDMIPGRTNRIVLRATEEGVFRGQCAEFCGYQHALMGLVVRAEPPRRFAAWLERQARPAPPPRTAEALRGLEVFLGAGCGDCHSIRGTPAAGELGPDLTHLAGRLTLAGAALPNTRGHLGGWIADPQRLKPGSNMPRLPLGGAELTALLDYLETLR